MALGIAKIAAKVSAVGGVLYWSVQQGIWGSSKEGSEAGKKLTRSFVEPTKKCIEKMPSLTDLSSKEYWNSGVSSWLNSVSQLSEMGSLPTKKSKSTSSLWDATTLPDPKSSKEASKTAKMASQKVPSPQNIPNSDPKPELNSTSPQKNQTAANSPHKHQTVANSPHKHQTVANSPHKHHVVMNQQSQVKANKEPAVPKTEDDNMAKTVSFKLSKNPSNEYIVEQIVTTRSPRNEYAVEQVTKSRLTSPPPLRDHNWSISPVRPALDHANKVVMKGFNYVTSVVSPPKAIVRVPTSVRVQSAEKPGGPTRCCNETSPDGQQPVMPMTLQDYEPDECLKGSEGVLQQHIASCEAETAYIDEAVNEAEHFTSMSQAELSEGCYNTKIAELIRSSIQPSAEATENEPISPTAGSFPGIDQFSPPKPMLFMPFYLEEPLSPVLLSNTNPSGRLQLLRSPRQPFYAQAFGRRAELSRQRPSSTVTVLGRGVATGSPPVPTVLMPPRSIFKGISPAEIARSLPLRSITDLRPTKSVSIQTELSLTEAVFRSASVSPRKSMIANIAPPTPSYILPSPCKPMRSRPKTSE